MTELDVDYQIADLSFTCTASTNINCMPLIQKMVNFYKPLMFPSGDPQVNHSLQKKVIKQVTVTLQTNQLPLDFHSNNETYKLDINDSGIFIDAHNSFGTARALSTLSQLIHSDYDTWYRAKAVSIHDFPAFPYRSVMVDSSRHFLPIETLKRQVAALSIAKMSILHLHEPDSQSFPTLPDTEPAVNYVKGCWVTGGKKYYHTMADLRDLAEYAKDLGVFILLEYDMPGHASSWASADPSITCSCRDVINPSNELTFTYIRAFITDVFNALYKPFGFNPMIHLGGDEVNQGCFNQDSNVSNFMRQKGWNARQTWQYLHQRVVDIIIDVTNSIYPDRNLTNYFRFYWQESFGNDNNMSAGGVVHAWMSSHDIGRAANKGIYAIRSQGWYLDVNQPGGNQEAFVDSWMDFYRVRPDEGANVQQKQYCLGGGSCQWGEKVHNFNIDEQIWPRSIAVAEVLWSNPQNRNITPALKTRLNDLTCKLRQAGIESGAMIPSNPCPGVDDRGDGRKISNWRVTPDTDVNDDEDEGWKDRRKK